MKKTVGGKLTRRSAIKVAATGGLSLSLDANASAARSNAIIEENKKQGSRDWQLTRVRFDNSQQRTSLIEGYCSKQSVMAGERLDIYVSADPNVSYRLDIFRTGYYGGTGARLMKTIGPLEGKKQVVPQPGEKNLHECSWDVSTSLVIPKDWLSGVYIGKLRTLPASPELPYWESYIIFIVRDERPVDLLFQCSDNTWQAYNRWPSDFSLYTHPNGVQGPWAAVSFDRPYGRQSQYMDIVNDPLSFGSGEFLSFERPFSYFLEAEGYDVSYCANCDLLTPDRALKAKAFLSVGHDEYWDIRQFRSVEKLKESGVNLLFFSGNTLCWVSPFSDSAKGVPNRTLFRGGPYGASNNYAEDRQRLFGPYPERGPDEGLLMGVRNIRPVNGGGDWIIVNPKHWIFKGTGVKKGDSIPGLIGWEFHGDAPDLPGLEVVAEGTAWSGGTVPSKWQSVVYDGPKNNFVFNAATIFWAQGLSSPPGHTLPWSHFSRPHGPDERVQQITRNLLNRAIS
jgi:hypothetical protein